jgi:hypothetical protein
VTEFQGQQLNQSKTQNQNMRKSQYRQGDVLIEKISKTVRKTSKQKRLHRIVLAEGEATGHAHVLNASPTDPADWWKEGDEQFANLSSPAIVVHEEHSSIKMEEGTYRITRQREYSPEEIRNVAD